jgi:hypothetical protein
MVGVVNTGDVATGTGSVTIAGATGVGSDGNSVGNPNLVNTSAGTAAIASVIRTRLSSVK